MHWGQIVAVAFFVLTAVDLTQALRRGRIYSRTILIERNAEPGVFKLQVFLRVLILVLCVNMASLPMLDSLLGTRISSSILFANLGAIPAIFAVESFGPGVGIRDNSRWHHYMLGGPIATIVALGFFLASAVIFLAKPA